MYVCLSIDTLSLVATFPISAIVFDSLVVAPYNFGFLLHSVSISTSDVFTSLIFSLFSADYL